MSSGPVAAQERIKFVSPEIALEHGLGAYRSGFYSLAESALRYAAERRSLLGQYYLAHLYSDPKVPFTSHVKAYELYSAIVEEHAARIDVVDDPRARYVGKSLTALARYWLRGVAEIGLQPNATRAAGYLQEAATFFRDEDAQFELAKLYLTGEGVREDHRHATHWLSVLSKNGHPGAQAFLADLYWRGKILSRDPGQALALITLAVENAPGHERIWIEDIYQSIFCGIPDGVRSRSEGLVASYRQRYSPRPGTEPRDSLGQIGLGPVRTCADGTPLPTPSGQRGDVGGNQLVESQKVSRPELPKVRQGDIMGIGAPGLGNRR